jgi:LasA protease
MDKRRKILLILFGILFLVLSCTLPTLDTTSGPTATPQVLYFLTQLVEESTQTEIPDPLPQPTIGEIITPTPNEPLSLPTLRTGPSQYIVQANDTLAEIAMYFSVSTSSIIEANHISNPDHLEVGQILFIPAPQPQGSGSDLKIIPDSELVYGPNSISFDLNDFIAESGGYLSTYQEEIDKEMFSGADIVRRVSQDYSVNPRILLAVLEYQGGWVTQTAISSEKRDYPLGLVDKSHLGLYKQLTWAANVINRGYYMWQLEAIPNWVLQDDAVITPSETINAGTAAVQYLMSNLCDTDQWQQAVGEDGIFHTFWWLFGYPFNLTYEPLIPEGLAQPELQLPFEPGVVWHYTGGPHGAWGSGSAWAALDFAPRSDTHGCVQSNAWVVAIADGVIARSGHAAVVLDLDGDGYEQTGWTILYMHIETRDRIAAGTYVHAGDRIGHPSCEGGVSTGTHTHIARRYNGEWIAADRDMPFVMDGWVSSGSGAQYQGYLTKDDEEIEAFAGGWSGNQIWR